MPSCYLNRVVDIGEECIPKLQANIELAPIGTLAPLPPQKIQFSSHTIQEGKPPLEQARCNSVSNICGFTVQNGWDSESLIAYGDATTLIGNEEELRAKLGFIPKIISKNTTADPFAGIAVLQQLKSDPTKYKHITLFEALEFHHIGQTKDAAKALQSYMLELQNGTIAHPLFLLATARILNSTEQERETTVQHLLELLKLYPSAEIWLTDQEKSVKLNSVTSLPFPKVDQTTQEQWDELKVRENCASKAMDELLALTGLQRVKTFALALFKNALTYTKLSDEARKQNQGTLNFVFLGNPGTGKTTVARLFAQILRDTGMRKKTTFTECTAQQIKDDGPDAFRDKIKQAIDGVLFIDEAYDLDPKADFKGKPIVSELLTASENLRDKLSIILAGYQDDMESKLFSFNEGLKSRFEEVHFDDFNAVELRSIWNKHLTTKLWTSEQKASDVVIRRLTKMANRRGFGNAREVRRFCENAIRIAMAREDFDPSFMQLQVRDIIGDPPSESSPAIAHILQELDSKIGWRSVKKSVRELIELCKTNYEREIEGLPPTPAFVNRLFLGNPGTGKTTCATIYGKMLKALGILAKGEVVQKTASDFIGSVVGQSADKTNEILRNAKGKVLVIDEAYNLNDTLYGKQVLDTLVEKVQGNPGDDIAVLLLGYEPQIREMLRTQNPGLARRFPVEYAFHFEDYTDEELVTLFNSTCRDEHISLSSFEVSKKALDNLKKQRLSTTFGNAGSVKTLIREAMQKSVRTLSWCSASGAHP